MVNILAIISPYAYASKISGIIKETEETVSKILYVSLNKTYQSLYHEFEQDHIDISKFFFIDTITLTVMEPEPVDNCVFLHSAENVQDLYTSIIQIVKQKNIDAIIFDSLSSLTTYKNTNEIIHFITTLLGSLSLLNCTAIFTCLSIDEDTPLIQHLKMKVEKILELS